MAGRFRMVLRKLSDVLRRGSPARLDRIESQQSRNYQLLSEIRAGLLQIEKTLQPKILAGRLTRVEQNVEALLRLTAIDRGELPYPQRLTSQRFGLRSQNGEDGLTLALLGETDVTSRRFVELGCGGNGGNSGFLAEELGWSGLMVDTSEDRLATLRATVSPERVTVVNAWITVESVNELVETNGFTGEIDVLSIDIDGNDYWIWESLDVVSPRLVAIEYNSMLGPDRSVVVPYQSDFRRRGVEGLKGTYYGASLRALSDLARTLDYRLVAVEARGVNAYFLRNDVAPHVPEVDARAEFRLLDKYVSLAARGFDLWSEIETRALPLVDLDVSEPVTAPDSSRPRV